MIFKKPEHENSCESASFCQATKVAEYRRLMKKENQLEYEQALITTKEKIRDLEGIDIKESMQDQIRQWFIECRLVLCF